MTAPFPIPDHDASGAPQPTRRVRLLASVRSGAEARCAVAAGADVVDAKEPSRGALGAVDAPTLAAIRAAVPPSVALSATIGDVASGDGARIADLCAATAAAGVDIVKIGLFPPGDPRALLDRLTRTPEAYGRRVLVMLADRPLDLSLVARLPDAGFCGVMLDTADKAAGSLFDVLDETIIARFAFTARRAGLGLGLAGALRLWHIPRLLGLRPDIAGFRGALCRGGSRQGEIDPALVAEVRRALAGAALDCAAE